VDFWAQHKDFVLKVLAGLGIFLVALIARGIAFGEDPEMQKGRNAALANDLATIKLASRETTRQLTANTEKLRSNAAELTGQVGFNAGNEDLESVLIRRTLSYLRRYRGAPASQVASEADGYRADMSANLNGGFGQLRLTARDELREEANENNVRFEESIGFENVVSIESSEDLRKYLLQLELVTRVIRLLIDARVDLIEDLDISRTQRDATIPDANPEFLQEHAVTIVFVCSVRALDEVVNSLASNRPVVPWREVNMERVQRPPDHLRVTLKLLALAANPEVPFVAPEDEEGGQ
jgi:hypothetical protein